MPERRQPAQRPRTISVMTFLAFYFLVLCGGDAGVGARGVAFGASVAGLGRSSAASDSALPSAARNGGSATPIADSLGLETSTWSVTVSGSRRRRAAAADDDDEEDAALLEESGRTVTPQPQQHSPRHGAASAAATPADPRGTCAAATAAAAAASATSTSGAGSVTSESRTQSPASAEGMFDAVADAIAAAVRAVLPRASDAVVRAARPHADLPGAVVIPYDAAAAQEAFAAAVDAAATADEADASDSGDDVVKVFLGQLRRDATPEFVYFLAGVVAPDAPVLRVEMHTNAAGSNYDAFGRPRGKGCAWLYTTRAGAAQLIAASKTAFLDVDEDGSEVLIVAGSGGNARFAGYCAAFKDQAGRPEHLPRQPFVAELPKGSAAASVSKPAQQQLAAASPAGSVARGAVRRSPAVPARQYGGYHNHHQYHQSEADYSSYAQQYAYQFDGVSPDAPAYFSFRGAAAATSHAEYFDGAADPARVYVADGSRFRWNPYGVTA